MLKDELVGADSFDDINRGSYVFCEAQVHVGAVFVVVGKQEDEGGVFLLSDVVVIVGQGILFEVAVDHCVVVETVELLHHLYFELDFPVDFV
jgi:hypothetical protein